MAFGDFLHRSLSLKIYIISATNILSADKKNEIRFPLGAGESVAPRPSVCLSVSVPCRWFDQNRNTI